jgi:hypothetical protein
VRKLFLHARFSKNNLPLSGTRGSDCNTFVILNQVESTVGSVFSPLPGAVWYIGNQYTVQWTNFTSSNVDVDLLVQVGPTTIIFGLSLATNIPNNGQCAVTLPSTISAASNIYFITVRPTGNTNFDGYSRSQAFSILNSPSGSCPSGYVSSNGNYPGCSPCAVGTYVSC